MDDLLRIILFGVALAGFSAAVVEANTIAAQAIWCINVLAAETVLGIVMVPFKRMKQLRLRERERERDGNTEQTEDES